MNPRQRASRVAELVQIDPRCWYCAKALAAGEETLDHIVPACFGGTNKAENIALACRPCNQAKANRSLSDMCIPFSKAIAATIIDLVRSNLQPTPEKIMDRVSGVGRVIAQEAIRRWKLSGRVNPVGHAPPKPRPLPRKDMRW